MNPIQLPKTVTNPVLAEFAPPDETAAVLVLVRRVMNHRPFTLRGKKRNYLATFDQGHGCHVLKVPLSLWQYPLGGTYRDNDSVSHDIMGNRGSGHAPLVFLVVPWSAGGIVSPVQATAGAEAPRLDVFAPLSRLLELLGAPREAEEGVRLAAEGHADALRMFVDSVAADISQSGVENDPDKAPSDIGPPEIPNPRPMTPAERMKKMREAKAAKKAQLQPA